MANRNPTQDRRGHVVPWDEDDDLIARVGRVRRLRSAGVVPAQIAKTVGVALSTVYEDLDRSITLRKREAVAAVDEHLANLEQRLQEQAELMTRLYRDLDQDREEHVGMKSQNYSALLGHIRQCSMDMARIEMDMAKLDGSLVERKEVSVNETLLNLLDGAQ